MKQWIKKFFRRPETAHAPPCEWLDVGPNNPFDVRILNVLPCTQTLTSTTQNRDIAKSFVELRQSDGSQFRNVKIEGGVNVSCDLNIPFPDEIDDGPIFKASEMEDKWDIYVYDSIFYFVRSWLGNLIHRAPYFMKEGVVNISAIESDPAHLEQADQVVYFLLVSHALGRPFPNPIPPGMGDDAEQIALHSFASFGRIACCATHSDLTDVSLAERVEPTDR
jgi:hypothetical protein